MSEQVVELKLDLASKFRFNRSDVNRVVDLYYENRRSSVTVVKKMAKEFNGHSWLKIDSVCEWLRMAEGFDALVRSGVPLKFPQDFWHQLSFWVLSRVVSKTVENWQTSNLWKWIHEAESGASDSN